MANETTTSVITSALQIDYLPGLQDVLNNTNILMSRMERNETDFAGKHAYIAMHTGRNEGVGARAESGTLPTAQTQVLDNATFPMRYVYGRIQVTGPAMGHSKGNSYAAALDLEMRGLARDLKRDANRMMFGDGSGNMAQVKTAATTTVIAVHDVKNIRVNMAVDIIAQTDNSASTSNQTVTAVSKANNTFTIASSTVVTTDFVTRAGTKHIEPYGLRNTCEAVDAELEYGTNLEYSGSSPTDFGSISRETAGNEFWQGNVDDNSGTLRALTLELMQSELDDIEIAGNGEVDLIIGSHAMVRKVASLVTPDRRFNSGYITLDGGYKAVEYNEIPVTADRDCQKNRLYYLDLKSHVLFQIEDWNWLDDDGAILSRVADTDSFEATLRKYYNVGSKGNNQNGILKDLKE